MASKKTNRRWEVINGGLQGAVALSGGYIIYKKFKGLKGPKYKGFRGNESLRGTGSVAFLNPTDSFRFGSSTKSSSLSTKSSSLTGGSSTKPSPIISGSLPIILSAFDAPSNGSHSSYFTTFSF